MPPPEARRAAERAAGHLEPLQAFADAVRLGVYAALPDELDTEPIQELARAAGKPLLWPRVVGVRLEFANASAAELVAGAFGVPAPGLDRPAETLGAKDLILLPGRGFDRRGVRLGRGGGFYDRARWRTPGLVCLGLAYAFQLVEVLPEEPHDLRVQGVVTDAGFHPVVTPPDRSL